MRSSLRATAVVLAKRTYQSRASKREARIQIVNIGPRKAPIQQTNQESPKYDQYIPKCWPFLVDQYLFSL